jgi:hypothetical protein
MTNSHQANSNMLDSSVTAAASISDVSRMVGLSRGRFYQLMRKGVFPSPVYDVRSRRPYFTDEQQRVCLEVRKMNCGVNGRPILFYARKALFPKRTKSSPRRSNKNKPPSRWNGILEGLKSLGLEVTSTQVEEEICSVYPSGTDGVDDGEVLRNCYRKFRARRNCSDIVGR